MDGGRNGGGIWSLLGRTYRKGIFPTSFPRRKMVQCCIMKTTKHILSVLACGMISAAAVFFNSGCTTACVEKVNYCECGADCKCAGCKCGAECKCGSDCKCEKGCKCGKDGVGRWALTLPYADMNTGWLKVTRDGKASLLWRWGSPMDAESKVEGDKLTVTRRTDWPRKDNPADQRFDVLEGVVNGNEMELVHKIVSGEGKVQGAVETVKARRIPAVGPAPDLSKIVYGKPIKLIAADSLDGWKVMSDAFNGWSVKDGVLSNKVRDENGKVPKPGTNLQTVRADFLDFNLKTEVRLPKDSNSGIYLRGIYEIQMVDSYGKDVNCHHMGALYGRVTPSVAAEKPAGEWQTVDITLYKRHVTVVLNGQKIIDNAPVEGITGGALQPCEFTPGPLYLQGDHADADYRNMVLTPIVK